MTCCEQHFEGHHHHHTHILSTELHISKLFAVHFVIQSLCHPVKDTAGNHHSCLEEETGPKIFDTLAYVPWGGLS